MGYLADKYDASGKWHPSDPQIRGRISQRLFFDFSIYKSLGDYYYMKFLNLPADPAKLQSFRDQMQILDGLLEKDVYVAGSQVTIADVAMMTTITTIELMKVSIEEYPHVKRWAKMCTEKHALLPAAELTDSFKAFVDNNKNYSG